MKFYQCVCCAKSKQKQSFPRLPDVDGFELVCLKCKRTYGDEWEPKTLGELGDAMNEEIYQFIQRAHFESAAISDGARPGFKICYACRYEKAKPDFSMSKVWKGALSPICQVCADQIEERKDEILRRAEREAHEDLLAATWWVENRAKVEQWIKEYSIDFVVEQLRAQGRQREAAQLRATPSWADPRKIEAIYAEACRISRDTGVHHHVDHIVPLQGPRAKHGPFCGERIVYGLHWEGNLRVIPRFDNLSKGNRAWPDMPEELYLIDEILRHAA